MRFRYEVFLALLDHLYTDAVDISAELALPLLAAADFLGVEHLKHICTARIEAELSVISVCRALTVADSHHAEGLKDTCVDFIVAHFREVCAHRDPTRSTMGPHPSHGTPPSCQVHVTDGFKSLPRPLLDLVHEGISACLPVQLSSTGLSPARMPSPSSLRDNAPAASPALPRRTSEAGYGTPPHR